MSTLESNYIVPKTFDLNHPLQYIYQAKFVPYAYVSWKWRINVYVHAVICAFIQDKRFVWNVWLTK